MITVSVLGSGNVATHLIHAFLNSPDIQLVQVFSRNIESIRHIEGEVSITDNLDELKLVDCSIIAVSDGAIKELSSQVNIKDGLIVHTAGSVLMDELIGDYRKGVFYPLQTFSKEKKVDFKKIPICIEVNHDSDLTLLEKLASAISENVYIINSEQRQSLHTAAVFVNNFTNHMYEIGYNICEQHQLPFELLYPLIKETAKKIKTISPHDAQTGPAIRKDQITISKQLSQLTIEQKEMYAIISKSISNSFNQI